MLYRTVIIEDDSVITHLNRRYVEMDNRFCVVQTFSAAHPALFWLRSNPVDLIILDVYMPQMSGLDLLRALRAEGVDADVIMVTSADDATTIEAFMRLGVTDYLIKPFGYERFQLALKTFCQRRNAIHSENSPRPNWIPPCSISPPREPAAPLPCPKGCRARPFPSLKATSVTPPRRDIPVMTLPAMSGCPLSPCGAI